MKKIGMLSVSLALAVTPPVSALIAAAGPAKAVESKKPNIIFFLVDDFG